MTRIHKYEIQRALGSGGMGTVYLARDPQLERHVAIKVLNRFADPELLARFIREGRAAAALRHVNIVTIYDVGQQDQQPFIAMEYVAGTPLSELIGNRPALSIAARIGFIEQVCAGLQFAHRAGIIHRDIKPANVIVDTDGVIRIVDFGIARISGSGMTEDGALIGTLNYMSPEQLLGDPVDHRSDIFAVGALAYELIAYQQAFPGTIGDGLLHRLTTLAPRDIDTLLPGLDSGIATIIGRALQKRPDDRYHDLDEMRDALRVVRRRLESAGHSPLEAAESRVFATSPALPSVLPERAQGRLFGLRRSVAVGILAAILGTGLAAGLLSLRGRRAEAARIAAQTETAGSGPTLPAAPVSAPANATTAPSSASTTTNDADLDSVRRIVDSGDLPTALTQLRGLGRRRNDAGFRSLAERAARQAVSRMELAHAAAVNAGAADLSPAAFAEARADYDLATRAMDRQQFLDAGERSLAAARRFERAVALAPPARGGTQPIAPSSTPSLVEATPPSFPSSSNIPPVVSPPAISATAKAPPVTNSTALGIPGMPVAPDAGRFSTAPPPAPAPAASSTPAPSASAASASAASAVEREQMIQQTLAKYRAAFRDHDIDALVAVYPGVPREERQRLEKAFKDSSKNCRSYEVLQGDPAIFVTGPEASVAQVTVQSSYSCTPTTGQRDQVASMRDVFEMKKVNGAWVIARIGSMR